MASNIFSIFYRPTKPAWMYIASVFYYLLINYHFCLNITKHFVWHHPNRKKESTDKILQKGTTIKDITPKWNSWNNQFFKKTHTWPTLNTCQNIKKEMRKTTTKVMQYTNKHFDKLMDSCLIFLSTKKGLKANNQGTGQGIIITKSNTNLGFQNT